MFVGQLGAALALGLAAIGSSIGIGVAGQSAAGAWAKEAKAGLGLRFTYIILLGMPISQTIYAMIVMNRIRDILMRTPPGEGAVTAALTAPTMSFAGVLLAAGIAVGLAELFSAWMQGKIGAAGIRAICEGEGKGFAFMIIAMGVVETVGIFAMVFALGLLPKIAKVAG
ncbi:MAG TPA: V-type ATP synthase subunit K [Phycisphaerae bacterium]|nr:V-type ATP synthase subunit K [Phycisphaerae bacterium]